MAISLQKSQKQTIWNRLILVENDVKNQYLKTESTYC